MKTDLKHLLKSYSLSNAQRRLLNALAREPAAHPYAKGYMARHQLTSGGVRSALRRLERLNLVAKENGVWQIHPLEMRRWYSAVKSRNQKLAEDLQFAELSDEFWGEKSIRAVLGGSVNCSEIRAWLGKELGTEVNGMTFRIFGRSLQIFRNSDAAISWMMSPNPELDHNYPLQLIKTTEGAHRILELLSEKFRKTILADD